MTIYWQNTHNLWTTLLWFTIMKMFPYRSLYRCLFRHSSISKKRLSNNWQYLLNNFLHGESVSPWEKNNVLVHIYTLSNYTLCFQEIFWHFLNRYNSFETFFWKDKNTASSSHLSQNNADVNILLWPNWCIGRVSWSMFHFIVLSIFDYFLESDWKVCSKAFLIYHTIVSLSQEL